MKILLGNTGRGGELAIFTSIIKAYRECLPNATIHLLTCDNGIYEPLFRNSPDHDGWTALQFRDKQRPHYMNPVGAMFAYFAKTKQEYDHQEYACEYNLSPASSPTGGGTIIGNCYKRIKHKYFRLNKVRREIFIYPIDKELKFAERTFEKYGKDLVVVSYNARSASPIMNPHGYQELCNQIAKHRPVAFTAKVGDAGLNKHIDLRGITFSALFALSGKLQYFVGPDTATTWIVSNMPGKLVSIRGDKAYPISNTGLVSNGYRAGKETFEIDFHHKKPSQIIDRVLPIIC